MTLSLSLDTQLQAITDICGAITGIRHAYNYDEWPDSPPGLFNRAQAMHLTGYPEEGDGWRYGRLGIDMNQFQLVVPLYTVVIAAAQVKRSRSWVTPFLDSYPAALASAVQLDGNIAAGSAMYQGGRVVRQIPDWEGYSGYYMLRHEVLITIKGHVVQTP